MATTIKSTAKNYITTIVILLSFNACNKDVLNKRTQTTFNNTVNISDNSLPYTNPNCNSYENVTTANYSNFNLSYSTYYNEPINDSIISFRFRNYNDDEITIYINNLKEKRANFDVISNKYIKSNQAFVKMKANANSSSFKYDLESNVGKLHVMYDEIEKNWSIQFCDLKFYQVDNYNNPILINGKFLVN